MPGTSTPVSATLAMNEEVARRRRLGIPTVPLGFGEAGLPVHPLLTAELATWAGDAAYGPSAGIAPLRDAAAGYWTRRGQPTSPEQVVAGPGSKPLLWAILGVQRGGVALPKPCWVSYAAQAALHGRPVHRIPVADGEGGVPDPDRLDAAATAARRAGDPIRTVVVTLPDNPTGLVAAPSTVAALCAVADAHDLLIVSDEIYRDLVYDDVATPLTSPAQLAPARTIVTSGLSKSLALGGWRIGVARFPAEWAAQRDAVVAAASEVWSAPAQPVQRAAALAFTEPLELRDRMRTARRLYATVTSAVAGVFEDAGACLVRPSAAFYVYPSLIGPAIDDDVSLAALLLDKHGVATLPGSAFGDDPSAMRLRIATSQLGGDDDEQREAALRSDAPLDLPWIADQLDRLAAALR
jgi:aspartate aminotransferase